MQSPIHGKNTVILIAAASVAVTGTHSDLSQFVDSSEISRKRDANELTTYGNDAKRKGKGLKDSTFTMSGKYDSTASIGPRAVLLPLYDDDTTILVRVKRRPEGSGTGKPQDLFLGVITNYVETNPVADFISWSCDIEIDGEVDTTAQ